MRVYIAGPMTGVPEFNFPAFNAAAERMRKEGYEVCNPAENFGGRTDLPRAEYIREDLKQLLTCQAIALLPGWRKSRGACLEVAVGAELGMKIVCADPGATFDEKRRRRGGAFLDGWKPIFEEAADITSNARQADYGDPKDCCERIAMMWNGILLPKLRQDENIEAADVPMLMVALKAARQANKYKRDNLVDIAGYARIAAMIAGDE